jgi:hypothetical protein
MIANTPPPPPPLPPPPDQTFHLVHVKSFTGTYTVQYTSPQLRSQLGISHSEGGGEEVATREKEKRLENRPGRDCENWVEAVVLALEAKCQLGNVY